MHIEKLKYFIDLYECGSYTETARKNYISQTSVTQYIHALENEFRLKLFDRTVTPVRPTPAGELFYQEARILWEQYGNMRTKMEHFQQNRELTLRIAYASMVEIQSLLPVVDIFKKRHPHVALVLSKALIRDLAEGLEKNVYDLAICIDSAFPHSPLLRTRTLHAGKYAALVGKNHPLFHADEIGMDELYRYPLIMLSPESIGNAFRVMEEKTLSTGYIPNIVKTVPDLETEMLLIITENLIGFAPDNYNLVDFNGNIRLIPVRDFNHTFRIELACMRRSGNPAVQLFWDTLDVGRQEFVF